MKLERQVASLELSKKLKELGYPFVGAFEWVLSEHWEKPHLCMHHSDTERHYDLETGETYHVYVLDRIKAPTVAELGEWLPDSIYIRVTKPGRPKKKAWLEINKNVESGGWDMVYATTKKEFIKDWEYIEGDNLVGSFAKMIIWLVENNYLNFSESKEVRE